MAGIKNRKKTGMVLGGILALGMTPAATATMTYVGDQIYFSDGSGTYSALSNTDVTVSVISSGTGAGLFYMPALLGPGGIGVGNSATNVGIGCADSGCFRDGSGYVDTESLTFTFSEKVLLTSLYVLNWQTNTGGIGDLAALTYYTDDPDTPAGTFLFTKSGSDALGSLPKSLSIANTDLNNLEISQFTLTGLTGTKTVNGVSVTAQSDFYVSYLMLRVQRDIPDPVVPVPAGAWLMGSALAALAGIARRWRA